VKHLRFADAVFCVTLSCLQIIFPNVLMGHLFKVQHTMSLYVQTRFSSVTSILYQQLCCQILCHLQSCSFLRINLCSVTFFALGCQVCCSLGGYPPNFPVTVKALQIVFPPQDCEISCLLLGVWSCGPAVCITSVPQMMLCSCYCITTSSRHYDLLLYWQSSFHFLHLTDK
jgi:hypothetical protein